MKWKYWLILNKDLLLSILKNFDVPFEQTQTKPEKGKEFKLNAPMETSSIVIQFKKKKRKTKVDRFY